MLAFNGYSTGDRRGDDAPVSWSGVSGYGTGGKSLHSDAVWSPVPELNTALLLGIGLAGMSLRRRKPLSTQSVASGQALSPPAM